MMDDRGFDYGILSSVGLLIAAAVILLMAVSIFRSTAPANTAIALESAADQLNGDIDTVASMAIPYQRESQYKADGIDLSVSFDRVIAKSGNATYARPLVTRAYPGRYVENGTVIWGDVADFREYLNKTFNATGSREDPIPMDKSGDMHDLMAKAGRSLLESPVAVLPDKPLVIEKVFIYINDTNGNPGGEPYLFVYQR